MISTLLVVGSRNAALISEQPPLWVREAQVSRSFFSLSSVAAQLLCDLFSHSLSGAQWREDAKEALAMQSGLNSSQRRAVAKAMVSSLTLWQVGAAGC